MDSFCRKIKRASEQLSPCTTTPELELAVLRMRSLRTATMSNPHSLQPEKAHTKQGRSNAAKKKKKKERKTKKSRASLVAQMVKNLSAMQETQV